MCYHGDEYDESCRDARELQNKLDNVTDFFEGVLKALYSKEALPKDFELWVEEIASELKVKLPIAELQIQRKDRDLRLISHYLLNLQDTKQRELV